MTVQYFSSQLPEDGEFKVMAADNNSQLKREATLSKPADVGAVLKDFKCLTIAPKELMPGSDETTCRLIQVGFRVRLPADTWIRWCRYKAAVYTIDTNLPIIPCSLHPVRITNKISYTHNIFINNQQIECGTSSDNASLGVVFDQSVLGYILGNEVNWDFLPAHGVLDSGIGSLLLAFKTAGKSRLQLKCSMFITLGNKTFGELSLKTPVEFRDIR